MNLPYFTPFGWNLMLATSFVIGLSIGISVALYTLEIRGLL